MHFLFPPEHLRACQEGMAISQLRATVTLCWVTCQHWSQSRLEGRAMQCSNHTYRLSLDITCGPETPPFLSIALVPKQLAWQPVLPPSFVPVVNSLVWPISMCYSSISFGWTAEICPNASSRIDAPGFVGWYPDTTANTLAISPHCYTTSGFWPYLHGTDT